jgi:hypothetical protein
MGYKDELVEKFEEILRVKFGGRIDDDAEHDYRAIAQELVDEISTNRIAMEERSERAEYSYFR